jgi:cytochrome c-type biogenesis protein CcmH/NrfG
MNYWKGLLILVAIDAALIAGCQFLATEPSPPPTSEAVQEVIELDRQVDSLMVHLQERPGDVDAMLALARLYTEQGWHKNALGPLARALQLDPHRRSLWVALDHAVEESGQAKITDAELVRAALEFVEAVEMWGHGC